MFKVIFGPTPGWIKDVEKNGTPARAVVLSDPKELIRGVAGYQGRDGWIDVRVRIEEAVGAPFEAKMQCRLMTALGGMLEPGMRVNTKYDPRHKDRVLLADDVNSLLSYRLKT
jgi:hypothetical protein